MIASLALAGALSTAHDGPAFRLALRGRPGESITIRASAPPGWIAAFCTPEVCAVARVTVRIPSGGTKVLEIQLHHAGARASGGPLIVRAGTQALVLQVRAGLTPMRELKVKARSVRGREGRLNVVRSLRRLG